MSGDQPKVVHPTVGELLPTSEARERFDKSLAKSWAEAWGIGDRGPSPLPAGTIKIGDAVTVKERNWLPEALTCRAAAGSPPL